MFIFFLRHGLPGNLNFNRNFIMNSSLNLIIFTFLPFFLHEILSVSYDGKMMCLLETWGVTTFFFCSQMFLMSETTAPTSTTLTRETQTGMAWATTVTTAP